MKFIFLVFLVLASSSLCSRQMRTLRKRFLGDKYASGCWPAKYNRGAGVYPCAPGDVNVGVVCYKKCKKGYVQSAQTCKSTSNGNSY